MSPSTLAFIILVGLGLIALVAFLVNVRRHHPENLSEHDDRP